MISLQYPVRNLETHSHPERPGRLTAIVDRLMLDPIEGVRWILPTAASTAQLERVHELKP
jgi:acetoin utilization deacetylase AcuC-like enzyme